MQDQQPTFYVTGGTIPPDAPSYVERAADKDLLAALQRGELCYVLNARQMGKSSLSVRTRQALEAAGTRTAFLDLQKFGSSASAEQWYRALLERIGSDLKLRAPFLAYWRENAELPPLSRLFGALRDVALEQILGGIVIFLDEIDVVRDLSFKTDEFFGAIRESHNARADDSALKRLTFCIIGTVAPTDLIRDVRLSPFNIGTRVRLADFTPAEAAPLAQPLPGGAKTLDRVLWWTNGHPYLTQRLCAELTNSASTDVDTTVARLFFAKSDADVDENIKNVRNTVLRTGGEGAGFDRTDLLTRYGRIASGKRVPDDDTDGVCTALRLSGLVTSADGLLRVRNRVYGKLFDAAWVRDNLPDAELRRQRAAVARARWQLVGLIVFVFAGMSSLTLWAVRNTYLATAEAAKANHLAYISAINLTAQNLEIGNYSLAEDFFDDAGSFARSERGFEWDYLADRFHPERAIVFGHRHVASVVTSVAYSPDGQRIVTVSWGGAIDVWDTVSQRKLVTLNTHLERQSLAEFSPDGKRIITRGQYGRARVWDVATAKELVTLKGHASDVTSAAFSPDGKHIVTGSSDSTATVWDSMTAKELVTLKGHTNAVTSVAFSPDGRRVVTAGDDHTAIVWNPVTAKKLVTLKGHRDFIESVAFSPDGKRIVTGSLDKTARVWDAVTGKVSGTLKGHTGRVTSVAFSPDGKRIVTGSDDKSAKVWNAATANELMTIMTFPPNIGPKGELVS